MKISTFIVQFELIKEQYGDLEVYVFSDNEEVEAQIVLSALDDGAIDSLVICDKNTHNSFMEQ